MNYEIPELFMPVCDSDLTPELRATFYSFFHDIIGDKSEHGGCNLSHDRVKEEVLAHPILVCATCSSILASFDGSRKWSLLEFLCEHADRNYENTIQFLVEANPHALLWAYRHNGSIQAPIHVLARNRWNCQVLSWIVERYPWVFQTKLCQAMPPHLQLVLCYVAHNHIREKLRTFYQLYPQGLGESGDVRPLGTALSVSLTGWEEPEADFFIWMAEEYPKAVYRKSFGEYNLLHDVCALLAVVKDTSPSPVHFKCTPNMAQICRYLIVNHPSLIRQKSRHGHLPIHTLAHRCNRPIVQDITIELLRAYPDCIQDDVDSDNFHPELSIVPFIQQVHSLIVDELQIDKETAMLTQSSQTLTAAAKRMPKHSIKTNNSVEHSLLLDSLSQVFCSWAKLRVDALSAKKEAIQERIADTCRLLAGDDED